MKKLVLFITAVTLLLTATLLGYGCSNESELTFGSQFNATKPGYKETVTYDVSFNENYNDFLKTSGEIDGSVFRYDKAETKGTFTYEFSVIFPYPADMPKSELYPEGSTSYVYKLHTRLDLNACMYLNGEKHTSNDYVDSTVYFLPAASSLAPIYSVTKAKYPQINVGNKAEITDLEYETSTLYDSASYLISTTIGEDVSFKSYEYQKKTAIDSKALLFAIRCLTVEQGNTVTVPAIDVSHAVKKGLAIAYRDIDSKKYTVSYNGGDAKEYLIKEKIYEYYISDISITGVSQTMLVQREVCEDIPNCAFVLGYGEGLPIYYKGSYLNAGALEYKIASINLEQ